jgi:hypothetical protein
MHGIKFPAGTGVHNTHKKGSFLRKLYMLRLAYFRERSKVSVVKRSIGMHASCLFWQFSDDKIKRKMNGFYMEWQNYDRRYREENIRGTEK